MLLRLYGAKIGHHVRVASSARVFAPWNLTIGDRTSIGDEAIIYNLGSITLGHDTTVSQKAHLCAGTHDYTQYHMPLLKHPISVGDNVWIATEAFIGPQVIVGNGSIVGARAVVVKNVPPGSVVVGNPSKIVRTLNHYRD